MYVYTNTLVHKYTNTLVHKYKIAHIPEMHIGKMIVTLYCTFYIGHYILAAANTFRSSFLLPKHRQRQRFILYHRLFVSKTLKYITTLFSLKFDMIRLLLFQKVESGGGPIFKSGSVVLKKMF